MLGPTMAHNLIPTTALTLRCSNLEDHDHPGVLMEKSFHSQRGSPRSVRSESGAFWPLSIPTAGWASGDDRRAAVSQDARSFRPRFKARYQTHLNIFWFQRVGTTPRISNTALRSLQMHSYSRKVALKTCTSGRSISQRRCLL